ncbi:hypothetical protein V8G54_033315 [Vigna mungo]|uniref:Uncharacterized protein n=1 Tax=Vigna mungo TaxID=3915 RepID=A0AAQ3RIQ5_VIGMU
MMRTYLSQPKLYCNNLKSFLRRFLSLPGPLLRILNVFPYPMSHDVPQKTHPFPFLVYLSPKKIHYFPFLIYLSRLLKILCQGPKIVLIQMSSIFSISFSLLKISYFFLSSVLLDY